MKYHRFAWSAAKKFFDTLYAVSFSLEDLVSLSFSAVITALDKYDSSKKKSFYSYWLCIANNAMKRYVREFIKYHQNASPISLDDENSCGIPLHDSVASEDIDRNISIYNSLQTIINDERCNLSKHEKTIILLSLDGYDMEDISKILHKNRGTIYRNYSTALNKIRHLLIDKK